MPIYHVTWQNRTQEVYEIVADSPEEAEERYVEGRLIGTIEDGTILEVEAA